MFPTAPELATYSRTIQGDTIESRFLRRLPWYLDGAPQAPDDLVRGLLAEAARVSPGPRFSIVTPLWNTPPRYLEELLLSVRCQSYPHWELVLVDDASPRDDHLPLARSWAAHDPRVQLTALPENQGISGARNAGTERARGDFIAFLDHDDLLHPSALATFTRWLAHAPDTNLIYSNEAKITADSSTVRDFLTKPPFDRFTLLRVNHVCHFTALRRDLLDAARHEGLAFRSRFDGCEDHDLLLRAALTGRVLPRHVPLFLYYWRMAETSTARSVSAKPEVERRRADLLRETAARCCPGTIVRLSPPDPVHRNVFPSLRPVRLVDRPRPTLLVMVSVHEEVSWTIRALEALERQEHDLVVRVLLMGPAGPPPALARWLEQPRRLRYATSGPRPEALSSPAARDHDLLLFLDGDVELRSSDALRSLALHLLTHEECGLAGLRLMARDGVAVLHGGLRPRPATTRLDDASIVTRAGPADFAYDEHACFGVSLACAMMRRTTLMAIGDLDGSWRDETSRAIDLCARVHESGHQVHYFGTLWGVAHAPVGATLHAGSLTELWDRHGAVLASWRMRSFRLTPRRDGWFARPASLRATLRERVGGRLKALAQRLLGPAHGRAHRAARATWHFATGLRMREDPGQALVRRRLIPPGGGLRRGRRS